MVQSPGVDGDDGDDADARDVRRRSFIDAIGFFGIAGRAGMPRRRSPLTPAPRVHLNEGEQAAARTLVLHGLHHLRADAQLLLDEGADADQLRDLRVTITASLAGDREAQARFGANIKVIVAASKRARHLRDGALWVTLVHALGDEFRPQMMYLGYGGAELRQGCRAWTPSSQVDPTIVVHRFPPARQLDLFSPDERDL